MANKTFLQLVNQVLLEMREPTVTTWDQTDYSELIGTFVNTAKRAVENAWQWHALRDTFTIATVAGTVTYALTGTDERAVVKDAWNYTKGWQLDARTLQSMNEVYFAAGGAGVQTGSVDSYVMNGVNTSGETQLDVYPVPVGVESLKLTVYAPDAEYTTDGNTCLIPWRPIVDTAIALARGERGEDGGIAVQEASAFAVGASGDAIAIDANKHGDDITWEAA